MRIGIIREHMVTPTPNHVAMSNQIDNEIKSILRDKLGAELVESVDPRLPDDPTVPNLTYTFKDAFSEIFPRHFPEIFSRTSSSGALLFAVPGHDVTSYDYLLKLSNRQAPLSDAIRVDNLAGIAGFPDELSFKFDIDRYLLQRGDERVKDWASWVDNAKFRQDSSRAGAENWENTVPPNKIGGPLVGSGSLGGITPFMQIPQIVVPAGYNQIVYEPQFALNTDKTDYISVAGTVQSLLPHPMPISILFFAGQGEEPTLLKVATAYEAATHHRAPAINFGPL